MIDAIADYWSRVESFPVLCPLSPGETASKLPMHAPERGIGTGGQDSWDELFADIERVVLPGLTHWQHPNFHAFFSANASFPAILGDLLCSGLGVQGMLWATSPACTEIETRVMDWLGELIGLSPEFLSTSFDPTTNTGGGGVIQSTASEATLVALLAGRARAQQKSADADASVAFTMYTSTQAHSSVVRAAMIAGLAKNPGDRASARLVDTDAQFAMRPDLLEAAIRADIADGRVPAFICATIGTTSSTAVDPVDAIVRVLDRVQCDHPEVPRAWLHVDAAHSGAALVCPEFRWMAHGVERADSFCFNPHKWLLTNFDCDCFWTRDRASLIGAMSVTPEYLRNAASSAGSVIDYRDWQIPLGRRFRSLKLWFVLRHYGAEGLRAFIRDHVRMTAWFEEQIRTDERFEIVAPRTVNLVCFRLRPSHAETLDQTNARTKAMLSALNATGAAYLTHTVLPTPVGDVFTIRFCVGSTLTQQRHVERALDLVRSFST